MPAAPTGWHLPKIFVPACTGCIVHLIVVVVVSLCATASPAVGIIAWANPVDCRRLMRITMEHTTTLISQSE